MESKDLLRIGLIALAGIALMYLINNYSQKKQSVENFEDSHDHKDEEKDDHSEHESEEHEHFYNGHEENDKENYNVQPGEQIGTNEVFSSVASEGQGDFGLDGNQYPKDCFPKDQLTPAELLPGDANSKWAQSVPAGQGELGDQNFLTSGHHVGVNTVGQTLRNANRQLRKVVSFTRIVYHRVN